MLTTPVIKDEDLVFPGEGWFLYWKTSASLWRTKLEELSAVEKVIIPINWSFHSDTGDRFDFANQKPETDLAKLHEICKELDKEVIFLLPVTPVPFLPNGGIPFILARGNAQGPNGIVKAFADSEGNINKLYSFFDPRIYTAYTRFCHELGKYFSRSGIEAGIWAYESGHISNGVFHSYIEDFSPAFENGFAKFLTAKKESEEIEAEKIDFELERKLQKEYQKMILDLYVNGAEKELSTYWQGVKKLGFLQGGQENVYLRSIDYSSDLNILDEALELLENGVFPSSVMLPSRRKKGVFDSFRKKVLSRESINSFYNDKTISTPLEFFFQSSYSMKIYSDESSIHQKKYIEEAGFINFCKKQFSWDYCFGTYENFMWEDELESRHNFFYFSGKDLNLKSLSGALKMFMNGLNVLIDKRELNPDLVRRLESFYLENDLEMEKIRYLTQIETISMGEGRLFIFDSSEIVELEDHQEKSLQFWEKVFNSLEFDYCEISSDEGIRYNWFERSVGNSELKYEKVKRLNIFNPSSYKRKLKIKYPSSFVFQKIIDEQNVEMSNSTHEIELSFMPKGSVSLDFGVISK